MTAFVTADGVLSADVPNSGTLVIAYPTGASQYGVEATGHKIVVNQVLNTATFAFGASTITVTNTSGVTWRAGQQYFVEINTPNAFPDADGDEGKEFLEEAFAGEGPFGGIRLPNKGLVLTVASADDTKLALQWRCGFTGIGKWTMVSDATAAELDTEGALNAAVDYLRVGDRIECTTDADGTPAYGTFLVGANDGTDVDLRNINSEGLANTD